MAPPQRLAQMSLQMVTSRILKNPLELAKLKEDLRRMKCTGLLEQPWALKREDLVRKLVQPERPNIFDWTIRDQPQLWIANLWREVYKFPSGRAGLANRMDGYIEGRFIHQVDPKDGYTIGDCWNARQRRVLKFLVPIIHLDKPTRVTILLGNTIFGVLDGVREVDWGLVFRDLAQRLAKGGWETKTHPHLPISIPPLRHLEGSPPVRSGGPASPAQLEQRLQAQLEQRPPAPKVL